MIVQEVFGIVNGKYPERSGGAVRRGFGVHFKQPLCPCFLDVEERSDSFLVFVRWRIAFFAHRFSAHLDAMGIVHQAVQDAVGDGGIADLLVPARDRQLGCQDGGESLVAVLTDLPDFAALRFTQGRHGPVIDDQNVDATQSCQEVTQAAVGSGQGQLTQQGCRPLIESRVAVAAGFLGQGQSDKALAHDQLGRRLQSGGSGTQEPTAHVPLPQFRKCRVDPTLVDRSVEPRLAQVFAPLLSVIEDATARQSLRELMRDYHRELVADRGMDMEAQVLEIIRELQQSSYETGIPIKEITQRFAEKHGEDYERKITPHWIGHIIRRKLGLRTDCPCFLPAFSVGPLWFEKSAGRRGGTILNCHHPKGFGKSVIFADCKPFKPQKPNTSTCSRHI